MTEPRNPPSELFHLRPPRQPRISGRRVAEGIQALNQIVPDVDGTGASTMDDQIESLKRRLLSIRRDGLDWEEATNVPRRTWAMIRLYSLYLGDEEASEWLTPFDEHVTESVLGSDVRAWHPATRRDATQFYFTQFDRIQSLPQLSSLLRDAWNAPELEPRNEVEKCWSENANQLFSSTGPQMIAHLWRRGESLEELGERFHIHEGGRFRDCLAEAMVLRRFAELSLFERDVELFDLCEESKDRRFRGGRPLGSKVVEILVDRVINEVDGNWEESWSSQLVPFACDPRTLDPAELQRWWGWADQLRLQTAIRGLTGLNIEAFIDLLEASLRGTGSEHQFPPRRDFLQFLFKAKIIQDARLVVHAEVRAGLDQRTRETLKPSWSLGGGEKTSFICLRCRDNVFLIEGTHNFALRGFVGANRFPIPNFWHLPPQPYEDGQLRVAREHCPIVQNHHQGDWQGDFLWSLRQNYHVDWFRLLGRRT